MTLRLKNPCSTCRRAGEKLFLKGDKCTSPHCPVLRRNYGPGQHGARRRRVSEYGSQLLEKQKLAATYGVPNRQLYLYYKKASRFKGKTTELFLIFLEKRLDNAIFRGGLTPSRNSARKAVTDGHILLNGKKDDVPSYQVKIGDKIAIKEKSQEKAIFKDRPAKSDSIPSWLKFNAEKKQLEVVRLPEAADQEINLNIARAAEFYSR